MANAILIQAGKATLLSPVPLQRSGDGVHDGGYDEAWLQQLIQDHPDILPVAEIEPGFGRLIPVSREVWCGHGYIDNLFVTAEGGIVIVEAKLWRNPEARRHVVAQSLDYAAALGRLTYAEFETAALGGQFPSGSAKPSSLYAIVADGAELDESAFIDAVATNLKRGRFLIIAAGDGVRSETETLANLLQSHAGARFTFALVAIELYRDGDRVFAVPRQLAKTVMIERGVVSILDDRAIVSPPLVETNSGVKPSSSTPRTTMTEEIFMEAIAKHDPHLPDAIRTFLARARELGVEPHWLGALNLKWAGWPEGAVNLGVISKEATLRTDPTNWKVGPARALQYQQDLALVFGGQVKESGDGGGFLASLDGKGYMPLVAALPEKADAWIEAMKNFIGRLKAEAAAEF